MDTTEIINKMIDDIIDGNNTDAKDGFESALSNKLTDALDARKIELEPFLQNKQQNFTEITDYEKIFYKMLFVYGDELGGYTGLIALNPFEVVKIADFFRVLEEEKNEHLENLKKNRG